MHKFSSGVMVARGGNLDAAIAQVKVAPSLKDLQALQAALIVHRLAGRWRNLDQAITDALGHLSAPRRPRAP